MSVTDQKRLLALLYNNPALWPEVRGKVEEDDFYGKRRAIFAAMQSAIAGGTVPTIEAIAKATDIPLDVIEPITSTEYDVANMDVYIKDIQRATDARNLKRIKEAATLSEAEQALAEAKNFRKPVDSAAISDIIDRHVAAIELEKLIPLGERIISTPWKALNDLIDIERGENLVIAARTSMGKSVVLEQITQHALEMGKAVDYYQLEMGPAAFIDRMAARNTGIPLRSISRRELTEAQWKDYYNFITQMRQYKLRLNWQGVSTLNGFLSNYERQSAEYKPDIVVIDYLQLMTHPGDRLQALALITSKLKNLAVEQNIAIIYAAQVNRSAEATQDKRPTLDTIRESGTVEQDADKVLFVYRPGHYFADEDPTEAELILEKNRKGPKGVAHVRWDGPRMRYIDAQGIGI